MHERRPRPTGVVLRLMPFVGALAAGTLAYLAAAREPRRAPVAVLFRPEATAAEERRWVDAALPPVYLPAPVAPAPCTTGRDWEEPLWEAHRYISDGRVHDAEVVLSRYSATPSGTELQNSVGGAVHSARPDPENPQTVDVLGAVHLLQTWAYVLLKRNATGAPLWRALKNPIGYTDLLSRRGVIGPLRGEYTWSRIAIPSPGCGATQDSLTTYHLYNNLILGYLANPGYQEPDPLRREREFARPYDDPVESNPLFSVLKVQHGERPDEREGWRWAVSNSERLLRELTWQRNRDSLQVPPWLAVNLAQVLDSARSEIHAEAVGALLAERDAMIAAAERSDRSIAPEQRQDLALALARLQLLRAVDGGRPPRVSPWALSLLDSAQKAVVLTVANAGRWRSDPEELAVALSSSEVGDSLGVRDPGAWLGAARYDVSRHFARRAAAADPAEQGAWERRARSVLAPGDPVPAELRDLESSWNLRALLQRHPRIALFVGAVLAFPLLVYLAWLLGRRQAIWVSYYRLEARERARD